MSGRAVSFLRGAWTFRKSLEKGTRKAGGKNGLSISKIEANISKSSLIEIDTVREIGEWKETIKEYVEDLTSLYE